LIGDVLKRGFINGWVVGIVNYFLWMNAWFWLIRSSVVCLCLCYLYYWEVFYRN
jgi:hypothetical protein